jgi:hypothetical protein
LVHTESYTHFHQFKARNDKKYGSGGEAPKQKKAKKSYKMQALLHDSDDDDDDDSAAVLTTGGWEVEYRKYMDAPEGDFDLEDDEDIVSWWGVRRYFSQHHIANFIIYSWLQSAFLFGDQSLEIISPSWHPRYSVRECSPQLG